MTEVTTVATMAALQQYFNPAANFESFSTDGSGLAKTAITNAFTTIPNLVSLSKGTAVTTKTIVAGAITAGVGYAGTSVIVTPETSKINLLANILSSCINNALASSANCVTLFANATAPDPVTTARPYGTTFTAATDVLQAAYFMLTNPTNSSTTNLTNLFNLSPAIGAPFQPSLASIPTDWTLGISYASSSICNAGTGGTGQLINSAADLAIDGFGGVWIANSEVGGNLTQLTASGIPVSCVAVGTGSSSSIAIDTATSLANVWIADSGASVV